MTALDPNQTFRLYGPNNQLIMHGSYNAVMERVMDSTARNDALSLLDAAARAVGVIEQSELSQQKLAEQREEFDRERAQTICDGLARVAIRFDAYIQRRIARLEAEEQQRKADRIKQALDALEETSGELTTHPATEPAHEEQLAATEHPPAEDDQGDLPRDLVAKVPVAPGNYPLDDPEDLDEPEDIHTPRPPVAISLSSTNEE
jgi:hypothetical protein